VYVDPKCLSLLWPGAEQQPQDANYDDDHDNFALQSYTVSSATVRNLHGFSTHGFTEDLDPLLSPLEDMLPSGADYGLGVTANDRMLVERNMTGIVLGCDTLTSAGRHTLLGVHEKESFCRRRSRSPGSSLPVVGSLNGQQQTSRIAA
jgi:hypothetical protein